MVIGSFLASKMTGTMVKNDQMLRKPDADYGLLLMPHLVIRPLGNNKDDEQ